MSCSDIKIVSKEINHKLTKVSKILNISVDDLIDRYLRRELFFDDFYVRPELTREELIERSRKAVEKDKKRGIYPKKHNFDFFTGLNNKYD